MTYTIATGVPGKVCPTLFLHIHLNFGSNYCANVCRGSRVISQSMRRGSTRRHLITMTPLMSQGKRRAACPQMYLFKWGTKILNKVVGMMTGCSVKNSQDSFPGAVTHMDENPLQRVYSWRKHVTYVPRDVVGTLHHCYGCESVCVVGFKQTRFCSGIVRECTDRTKCILCWYSPIL